MNKEVDKYMSRANQDIQWCEDRHSLKVYIAGLLEIIDGLQEENKILTQQWLAHSTDNNYLLQENKRLKENWNKLKEYVNQRGEESDDFGTLIEFNLAFNQVKLVMQELEKSGSDG